MKINQFKLTAISKSVDKTDPMFSSDDCRQLIKMYEDYYPKAGYHPPWTGYFILKDKQVLGSCGFTGKPSDGKVEIAYWTFREFEGQGVASFACKELISIAWQTKPSLVITAKTAPEHNASTKILQKNGFVFSKIVEDHEIGDAWLWVLDRSRKGKQ